jgi:hypothetical protein
VRVPIAQAALMVRWPDDAMRSPSHLVPAIAAQSCGICCNSLDDLRFAEWLLPGAALDVRSLIVRGYALAWTKPNRVAIILACANALSESR